MPQRQKFSVLKIKSSGSHGVPNLHLFNLRFLLVDYGKVFSANKLPQTSKASSRKENIL